MVAIASAIEHQSCMHLINHALEQEGSMHLINNVLNNQSYGINLPVAVCPLVTTSTSIGNVSVPLVGEKHRSNDMGPSSSCAVMSVGRHSYNATIHREKWSIQQLVDIQMHNHILPSSSIIVTVSELGLIITLPPSDAVKLNVSASSTKVSSIVAIT